MKEIQVLALANDFRDKFEFCQQLFDFILVERSGQLKPEEYNALVEYIGICQYLSCQDLEVALKYDVLKYATKVTRCEYLCRNFVDEITNRFIDDFRKQDEVSDVN
jgi:hypothetical protein